MSEDADTLIALAGIGIFILIILALIGAGIWVGVGEAIESRHRRKIELIKAETKRDEEIQKQWDKQFEIDNKGES